MPIGYQGVTGAGFKLFKKSTDGLDAVFANAAARDVYFGANPADLALLDADQYSIIKLLDDGSAAVAYQQRQSSAWVDITSLVQGGDGPAGATGNSYFFASVAARDTFFGTNPNQGLLENGLPINVNIGNETTATFIWSGTTAPATYDSTLWRLGALEVSSGTLFLGESGANISSGNQVLNFATASGGSKYINGIEYDDTGSTSPYFWDLAALSSVTLADVFDTALTDPQTITVPNSINSDLKTYTLIPATSGEMRVESWLGTDDTGAKLVDTTITVAPSDIDNETVFEAPNNTLMEIGQSTYTKFSGIQLKGGLQTSGIFIGETAPFVKVGVWVATKKNFVTSELTTTLHSIPAWGGTDGSTIIDNPTVILETGATDTDLTIKPVTTAGHGTLNFTTMAGSSRAFIEYGENINRFGIFVAPDVAAFEIENLAEDVDTQIFLTGDATLAVSATGANTNPPLSTESFGTNGAKINWYNSSVLPESVITADPGDVCIYKSGASSKIYQHKGASTGNTGWKPGVTGSSSSVNNSIAIFDSTSGDSVTDFPNALLSKTGVNTRLELIADATGMSAVSFCDSGGTEQGSIGWDDDAVDTFFITSDSSKMTFINGDGTYNFTSDSSVATDVRIKATDLASNASLTIADDLDANQLVIAFNNTTNKSSITDSSGDLTITSSAKINIGSSINLTDTDDGFQIDDTVVFYSNEDDENTASGQGVLASLTTGVGNVGNGVNSLYENTEGSYNNATGVDSLTANTVGNHNTADGYGTLPINVLGRRNTVFGAVSGTGMVSAANTGQNTFVGFGTGNSITTGVNNTIIGANVTGLDADLSNNIILADGEGNIGLQIDDSGNASIGAANTAVSKLKVVDGSSGSTTEALRLVNPNPGAFSGTGVIFQVTNSTYGKFGIFAEADGSGWGRGKMYLAVQGGGGAGDVLPSNSIITLDRYGANLNDNKILSLGTDEDFTMSHTGVNTFFDNTFATGATIFRLGSDTTATKLEIRNDSGDPIAEFFGDRTVNIPVDLTVAGNAVQLVPSTETIIYNTAELEAMATAGVITVSTSTTWIIKGHLDSATRIVLADRAQLHIVTGNSNQSSWTYSGTGDFISGTGGFRSLEFMDFVSSSTGTMFNLDLDGRSVNLTLAGLFDWDNLGSISNGTLIIDVSDIFDNAVAFDLTNVKITATQSNFGNTPTTALPFFTVNNCYSAKAISVSQLSGDFFSGATLFDIRPNFNKDSSVNISGVNIKDVTLFETGDTGAITLFADNSIGATSITSVTDSSGIARFNYTGTQVALCQEVVVSGFTTNTTYNGTHIVTATGATYFEVASIDFGSNETGSFLSNSVTVTSATHGLSDGDAVLITGTMEYNTGSAIYGAQTNTFDINATWDTAETSGTWNDGSLDHTSKYVNCSNNGKQQSSNPSPSFNVADNATTTTTTTSWGAVAFGTSGSAVVVGASNENFILLDDVTGLIRYDGIDPLTIKLPPTISMFKSGGDVEHQFRLFKTTGTPAFDPHTVKRGISGDTGALSLNCSAVLNPGDEFRLEVKATTTGSTITISDFSL